MKLTLAAKFIIYTTAIIIIVAFSFGWFLVRHERTLLIDQLKKRGISIATGIADNCQYGVLTEDRVILDSFIKSALQQRDVEYVMVTDSKATMLAGSDYMDYGLPSIKYGLPEKGSESPVVKLLPEGLIYNITVPVKMPESPKGTMGYVMLGITIKNLNVQMAQIKQIILIVTMGIALAAIVVSIIFSQRITKPIRKLVGMTNRIAEGDLVQKIEVPQHDEIGDLAESFNKMIQELKISRDAIEEHSRTLENKVRERTKELEQAYHELRQTQAQLIQTAKMTAIGQLGAGVAHELNNPIGGILGYAHFMLDKINRRGFKQEDIDVYKKYLGHIEKESNRCKGIVENLLSFSRKSVELKPVDIGKVIDDTLSVMEHQLSLQNIKVKKDFAHDLGYVEGHANQLQQVFTNIILNAQQAMKDGGQLDIVTRNLVNKQTHQPEHVEISFKDTGIGLPPESLPRIFEPFFTTKVDWKGTGLGLSVSYQIVESHKGTIRAESPGEGKGSTFTVILPAIKKKAET